jgi:hypothetical protein
MLVVLCACAEARRSQSRRAEAMEAGTADEEVRDQEQQVLPLKTVDE